MDLPPELRVIHEPVRLRILGLLYRQTDLGFTALRDALDLTAGNLASHATKLVQAGLVSERDALTRDGFEKRYQITARGLQDFERYLGLLDGFLAAARARPPAPTAATADSPGLGAPSAALAAGPPAEAGRLLRRRSVAWLAAAGVGLVFMAAETTQNILADASGSSYIGIGVTGTLVAALAPLERFVRRMAEGAFRR